MPKIVVDAMGGDNGSAPIVESVIEFKKNNPDFEIIIVGKKEELAKANDVATVIDAREVVPMEAGPLDVLRNKESSMYKAIAYMKDENCDAIISSGSTGAFLSATTISLRMIPGIKRAALVTPIPTKIKGKKMTVLDVGASNENSAEELCHFATMGRLYSQIVFGIENPTTYLLSNGSEGGKGAPHVKEAHKLLRESNFPNFQGNIEAREAFEGYADVVVCDGFTGNVFLKGVEGIAKAMSSLLSDAFKKNLWSKLGYLHVKGGIKNLKETFDYKSVGGAMLLGINGVVIKAHGNSDAQSFLSALKIVKKMVEMNIVEKIKEGVSHE